MCNCGASFVLGRLGPGSQCSRVIVWLFGMLCLAHRLLLLGSRDQIGFPLVNPKVEGLAATMTLATNLLGKQNKIKYSLPICTSK